MSSEYEELRLLNIRRNEEYLLQIGLLSPLSQSSTGSSIKRNHLTGTKRKQRQQDEELRSRNDSATYRRSSRIAALPTVTSYKETNVMASSSTAAAGYSSSGQYALFDESATTSRCHIISGDLQVGEVVGLEENDPAATLEAAAVFKKEIKLLLSPMDDGQSRDRDTGSCFASEIDAHLEHFLHSDNICKPVRSFGKAAVMSLSVSESAETLLPAPRFNKYSGAVEWRNCVYLWVNIDSNSSSGSGGSGYCNSFSCAGRHMMWFGGSKMHKDSRIIKRLVAAGRGSNNYDSKSSSTGSILSSAPTVAVIESEATLSAQQPLVKHELSSSPQQQQQQQQDSEPVLLFVRSAGENYSCLGRLRWLALNLEAHPVAIKWELVDYDLCAESKLFQRYIFASD